MSQWNAKTSTLIILAGLTVLILVIVYLPDVDLPDTAFHGGTAPVVIHARATAAPAVVAVSAVSQCLHQHEARAHFEPRAFIQNSDPSFRSILFGSIRC